VSGCNAKFFDKTFTFLVLRPKTQIIVTFPCQTSAKKLNYATVYRILIISMS